MLFQHRDALRLRRVRSDDRPHSERREQLVDFGGRNAAFGGGADHVREGAGELLVASLGLDLAPPPHGGVLLGDAEELEPDPLDLEGAGEELGAQIGGPPLPAEHRLELRLALANQGQQLLRQKLGDFVGVGGGARRGGISRFGEERCRERLGHDGGHTTRSRSGDPAKKSRRFSSALMPIATRVSVVALPRWGSRTTFWKASSPSDTLGSCSYTSRPAPAIRRSLSAAISAASSTTSPRAVLIRNASGRIRASRSRFIRCRVSGVAGQWSETKSASRSTSSRRSRCSAPSARAVSGGGG